MTDITKILRTEISRLARKEVRSEIESLKKTSAQQRSAIADLRRQIDVLNRHLRQLGKGIPAPGRQSTTAEPAEDGPARRFSPTRLAAHRAKLGLSATAYGKLAGVSGQSITNWEAGMTRPRPAQLQGLIAVRGLSRREADARLAEL